MFLGAKRPPPVIRKVTVPVKKEDKKPATPKSSSSGASKAQSRDAPSGKQQKKPSPKSQLLHPDVKRTSSSASPAPSQRRPVKRKAPTPTLQQFDSSSSSDDDFDETEFAARKKPRPSPRRETLSPDPNRKIWDIPRWTEADEARWPINHAAELTSGKYAKEYKPAFEGVDGDAIVRLRYPSRCPPERVKLVAAIETQGYEPLEDVIQTIEYVCKYYFPSADAERLTDDNNGLSRRLKRAVRDKSFSTFSTVVKEYNALIKDAVTNGTILKAVQEVKVLPLSLIERITAQIYSRTVSPQVSILKQYENGTDNVYGELLPRFSHTIFCETSLRSDQVFVDLGSGVGNVVLQAALEVGAESWGIEQMPNPCTLAREQLKEFEARCKRWSIVPGKARLLEGDFLQSPEIDGALRRADVILINNQAFTPELNNKIMMKFLDLKEGCQIVSLKSFLPEHWEIKHRNVSDIRNLLTVVKKEYWSGSVSWTDVGGTYFIAKKDSSRLQKFLEKGR